MSVLRGLVRRVGGVVGGPWSHRRPRPVPTSYARVAFGGGAPCPVALMLARSAQDMFDRCRCRPIFRASFAGSALRDRDWQARLHGLARAAGGVGGLLAPFESGGDQRVGDHRVRAAAGDGSHALVLPAARPTSGVIVKAGVKVHVMPAVGMAGLASFRTLCGEAGVLGDPAGRDVRRRVTQLNAVQPERFEAPRGHRRQRSRGNATTARARQHPVRHLGQAFHKVDPTQADLPDDLSRVEHGPSGAGLTAPPARPGVYPVASLVVGHRSAVPALNVRIGVGCHGSRTI